MSKVCPMKFNADYQIVNKNYMCNKDNCAWWSDEYGRCSQAINSQISKEILSILEAFYQEMEVEDE